MTTPTDPMGWASELLDAQIQARQDERPDEALRLGEELLARLPTDEKNLRAIAHNEMGHVLLNLVRDPVRAETHFRAATQLRPRYELASLGLFHALATRGHWLQAWEEVARFVGLRDSAEYRELLNDAVQRESRGRERELIDEARRLLGRWN